MSIKEKLSSPLVGLIFLISISLVTILTMAVILQMKRKPMEIPEEPRAEALKSQFIEPIQIGTTESVSVNLTSTDTPTKKPRKICESPECITLAHQLHNWRDINVDPCKDFYKATCGKYMEHSDTRGSRTLEKTTITMRLISEFLHKNQPSTSKSENTMKIYYQKCESVRNKTIFKSDKKRGYQDMFKDIQKIGAWPLVDKNWNDSKFDLNEMLSNMAKLNMRDFGLFQIKNDGTKSLDIIALPENNWIESYDFGDALKTILKANGIDPATTKLEDDLADVTNFIQKLSSSTNTSKEFNLTELKSHVPSVDFERIIENLVPSTEKGKQMAEKLKKKIRSFDFERFAGKTDNLESLLNSTPKRTLANFLIFKFIAEHMVYTRQSDCGKKVIMAFPRAALRVFVRKHFEKENLKMVSEIVENVRKTYVKILNESTWLHKNTKKNAILKVEKMKKMVGYPEDYEAPGALDKMFETLDVSAADTYYMLIRKNLRFRTEQMMEYVADDLMLDPEHPSLLQTNAFYTANVNSLSIMVSIIDDPLFDATLPNYAKIASTGSIIARKMGHGFDDQRTSSDDNTDFRWTPDDSTEYKKKGECLMKQYKDSKSVQKVDDEKVLNEMTAERLGAEATWRSLKEMDLSNEPAILQFDDYDIDKIFFHIYALNFCAPSGWNRNAKQEILTPKFRINNVFSNMKSFAETFNCPVGSPMNPKNKCELL